MAGVTSIDIIKNQKLVSGHGDRHIRFWDLSEKKMIRYTRAESTPCQYIHSYGENVFAGSSDSIKIYDSNSTQMTDVVMKPQSVIFDMKVKCG